MPKTVVLQLEPENELTRVVNYASAKDDHQALTNYIYLMKLFDKTFDVNQKGSSGVTALVYAVCRKKISLVRVLLKNGADANSQDSRGFTPLFTATGLHPHVEIARYLIEEGKASIDITNIDGETPLHGAALDGNRGCVELLLEKGAGPRAETNDGDIPVSWANDEETRKLLFDAMRKQDRKAKSNSKAASHCAWCEIKPQESSLKSCSKCRASMYCSKQCQSKHWKEGKHKQHCPGFILVEPDRDDLIISAFTDHGDNPEYAVVLLEILDKSCPSDLTHKLIMIKVELLSAFMTGAQPRSLRVTSECSSVIGDIRKDNPVYGTLRAAVERKNPEGRITHFWGEVMHEPNGAVKLFPGKPIPPQKW